MFGDVALVATVTPGDLVCRTRPRFVGELIGELEGSDRKIKIAQNELCRPGPRARLEPAGAYRDRTDRRRAAAGRRRRHPPVPRQGPLRLVKRNRAAGRLLRGPATAPAVPGGQSPDQPAPHMMAVVQLRKATPGREFHDARKAGGTPSLMAMRSLERRLSNIVYARMFADQNRREITHQMVVATGAREGPGATTLTPARPAHNPTPALRTSHFPDRQQPA